MFRNLRLFVFVILLQANAASAFWYTGNAGDVFSAEFILTGTDLVQRIKASGLGEGEMPNANALKMAIETTKVHSEERVFNLGADGSMYEVDALNIPQDRKIIINRSRWRELRKSTETVNRFKLVLHEYLYLMGVDDAGFRYSAAYIDRLSIGNYSPNHFWSPINPINILEIRSEVNQEVCYYTEININPILPSEEILVMSQPRCAVNNGRKILLKKFSSLIPPSKGVRGMFQEFEVEIYDLGDRFIGKFGFEPEWGRCLFPDDPACRSSGIIKVGGLEFEFGFLKN